MTTFFLTLSVFALAMLIMAIGVIFQHPYLRGSCGGPEVLDGNGEPLSCATCPNRKKKSGDPSAPGAADPGGSRQLPVL